MCNPLALVAGGTSIISGIMGNKAARKQASNDRKAAATNAASNRASIDAFKQNDPYSNMMADGGIMSQMRGLMGLDGADPTETLRKTPGYEFAFKQGMDGLQHSLGAQNALYSGAAMKEISNFGQGMADQLFQQTFDNRLSLMSGASNSAARVMGAETGTNNNLATAQMGANSTQAGATQSLIDGIGGIASSITGAMGKNSVGKPTPTPARVSAPSKQPNHAQPLT